MKSQKGSTGRDIIMPKAEVVEINPVLRHQCQKDVIVILQVMLLPPGVFFASERSGRSCFGSYHYTCNEILMDSNINIWELRFFLAEDEIAGICSAIVLRMLVLAITTTSGPGLSLKSRFGAGSND